MKKYIIFCWLIFALLNCNLRFKPHRPEVDVTTIYVCDTFRLWKENNLYSLDYVSCNTGGEVLQLDGVSMQSIYLNRYIFQSDMEPDSLVSMIQKINLCDR